MTRRPPLRPQFDVFEAFIIDCDGVLWLGETPVPCAPRTVEILRASGKRVIFVTNNSTLSRRGYVEKMRRLGFEARLEEVYSSSYVAAKVLSNMGIRRVFVVGEAGLVEELAAHGIEVAGADEAECIVVGLDRALTYRKLADALRCLKRGALFVATNMDPTLPGESGVLPGAGSIVAALEVASGRRPDIVIGKPSAIMFRTALEEWGLRPEKVIVIGDRLDTDIKGAKELGLAAALVLTGVSSLDDVRRSPLKPDFVLPSISHLIEDGC